MVTSSLVEVVRCAGGWLFDRGMAGWDVTVLTPDHGDTRPLQILGARAVDLETALALPVRGPLPHAIAVGTDLYSADARVHAGVRKLLQEGKVEVRWWGDSWPEDLDPDVPAVAHRLSVAARAFKARALGAACCPLGSCEPETMPEPTELFRTGSSIRTFGNV